MIDRYDFLGGLFWLVCSGLILTGSLRLQVGSLGAPGPGLAPLVLGIVLGVLGIGLSARSTFHLARPERKAFWADRRRGGKILATLAAMLAYAALIDPLGFVTVTFLLMFFLFRVIFDLGWTASVVVAVLTSASAYVIFGTGLGVQLPAGPIGI